MEGARGRQRGRPRDSTGSRRALIAGDSPDWSARRLPRSFFQRDVHELAKSLLGKHLVRRVDGELRVGRLVEVEAYGGQPDPASHGDSGVPTERTRPMFGDGGLAYVYLIYGMYDCFNVVAGPSGTAAAVLIRAAEPVAGLAGMASGRGLEGDLESASQRWKLMSGPGKLCQAMAITRDRFQGVELDGAELFVADGAPVDPSTVAVSERVGLNPKTCGPSASWKWRYLIANSPYLSQRP